MALCFWSLISFAPETDYLPLFWPVGALILHLVGVGAVRLRVRFDEHDRHRDHTPLWNKLQSLPGSWSRREFSLCSTQRKSTLILKPETYPFLFVNWCLSSMAVAHIILGTLVFSGVILVATRDAQIIAFRYAASSMVCKLVLVHELCGLREVL